MALLRFGPSPAAGPPLSPAAHAALLAAERARFVAEEQTCSRGVRTLANYQRANTRFSTFLQRLYGDSDTGWQQCRPDHVSLFLHSDLLPTLIGRTGDGVASSTVQGWMSSLGQCFELRGRDCAWCDTTGIGNPVQSRHVRTALRCYQQRQARAGQRPRSAVPMTVSSLTHLVRGMDSAIRSAALSHAGDQAHLLLRDLTHMLYMWNGARRGQDALYANWEDLYFQDDNLQIVSIRSAWAGEIPQAAVPRGPLLVVPWRSKTEHTQRPMTQTIPINSEPQLCGVRRLRTFYQWQRHRFRSAPVGPIFTSVRDVSVRLSSQAAEARVRHNVVTYGLGGGETMHSFRRGHVQAAQAAGEAVAVTMQRAGMQSTATFAKYADRGRHLR